MQDSFDYFHRHVEALIAKREYALAFECLQGGLADSRTYPEALLWLGVLGIHANRPTLAQAALSALMFIEPDAQAVQLLARTLPDAQALAFHAEAYRTEPTSSSALLAYLSALASAGASEHRENQTGQQQLLRYHASHGHDNATLAALAPFYARHFGLPCGSVWQQGTRLRGWCLTSADTAAPKVTLSANGQHLSVPLKQPQPLTATATAPAMKLCWFEVELQGAPASSLLNVVIQEKPLLGSPVQWQPLAPPVVVTSKRKSPAVAVLIPVYKGHAETLACVESVLQSRAANSTAFRVVAINDASPDTALINDLQQLADDGSIELYHQAQNQGFIGTVNHGLGLCGGSDTILLNADTLVHGNWLDRLKAAAYRYPDVASVTPLSNNGELMSLLAPCEPAAALTPAQLAELDNAAQAANSVEDHQDVEIDTGCGFCLYLRHDALAEQGGLDPTLTRGYGEESDWCYRAHANGRHHRGALDVVVAHQGGVSFGDEKRLRVKQNLEVLEKRYPNAERRFNACLKADPMRPGRTRLLRHWLRQQPLSALRPSGMNSVLLWPSLAQAERALAALDCDIALARTGLRELRLCGGQPHAWRLIYRLPEQRVQLESDLHTLGIHSLAPATQALGQWLFSVLPGMPLTACQTLVAQRSTAAQEAKAPQATATFKLPATGALIAVAGQPESLNQPELTELATTLSAQRQETYLLPLNHPGRTASPLLSSGRVFVLPLATSRYRERVMLCHAHLPLSAVLLLDTQPATLTDAAWLSEKLSEEQPLTWLVPEGLDIQTIQHALPHAWVRLPSLMSLAAPSAAASGSKPTAALLSTISGARA
ncbi:glycosyltransferase [Halomonas sp. Bachu 37]|uniref:glycosyltransferase family 2 protein n=1 Tax=Halomonas kashgarensis TaxID=3084920 RepID=UPI003216C2DD